MLPKVSIIIPTYNRSDFIGETLDSIIAQTFTNWECLIIDDGSTDYTEELAQFYQQKDKRIKFFGRPDHLPKGANTCRNYGFEVSKGEFINWFDDDDFMLPEFIERKVEHMNHNLDLVICNFIKVDNFLKKPDIVIVENRYSLFKSYALYEFKMVTNSVMFRKLFLEDKLLFNPDLNRGQETEFFLRMFYGLTEKEYSIVESALFLYRNHPRSKSSYASKSNEKFRKSLLFISFEFIKRGVELDEFDIIRFHYKKSIKLYLQSIRDRQKENVKFYNKNLVPLIFNFNFWLALELYFFGKIFWFSNKTWYPIEMRLKNYLN